MDVIDRQVDEVMVYGLVKPACSEWASNVIMVRKGDGTLQFCVDYRQLNEGTRKYSYRLPRSDGYLDALEGAVW